MTIMKMVLDVWMIPSLDLGLVFLIWLDVE